MAINKKISLEAVLFALVGLVYVLGAIFIDVLEVDAAQYASISLEMLKNGSYLEVYHRGADYLDKPPLLFWLGALFYNVFGVNHFVYRIPTMLSTALGAYSTFALAKRFYSKEVGVLAALILVSSQAFFLHNHDVRTDTLVTNFSIFTIWQLYVYIKDAKWLNLFVGFFGMALAMMSKGPIGLMVPVLALGGHLLYKRDWNTIFKWQWLVGLLWMGLLLLPMLIGLINQYGAHGPYFFFWLQSFGRLTGENVWDNNPDAFFLYHSFLWEFLPWMFIAYFGVFVSIYRAIKVKKFKTTELVTLAGFVLPFIALSQSHFQLPHYILVVFPLAAITTSKTIVEISQGVFRKGVVTTFKITQWFILLLMVSAGVLVAGYIFPMNSFVLWLFFFLFSTVGFMLVLKGEGFIQQAIYPSVFVVIALNLVLNVHFYPNLATYQTGRQVADFIALNKIPKADVYFTGATLEHGADFYSNHLITCIAADKVDSVLQAKDEIWLCADKEGMKNLNISALPIKNMAKLDGYHVTALTATFLRPETRNNVLEQFYFLNLKKE